MVNDQCDYRHCLISGGYYGCMNADKSACAPTPFRPERPCMREDLFTSRSSAYPVISHECMNESRDCRFRVEGVNWFQCTTQHWIDDAQCTDRWQRSSFESSG